MAELLKPGDSKQFNYTGTVQAFELLPGTYKLECYGAQGGNATGGYLGGKGGYYTGVLNVQLPTTVYVCVGSQGSCTNNNSIIAAGGYNGGGNAKYNNSPPQYVGAGGGATSITATNRGILKNFVNYKSEILLVAGGGGGANWWQGKQASHGGAGGGWAGSTGGNAGHVSGTGGTQTAGGTGGASGSFGQGGYGAGIDVGSAGGGGGYYGGGASHDNNGGGGGSGYANTSKLTSISYANGKRSGHGQAIITAITIKDHKTLTLINADRVTQTLAKYPTETVNISVDTSKNAVRFKEWKVEGATVSDKKLKTISFIMPDNDVNVEALLYDLYNLMVINSDGVLQELQAYETEKVDISLGQYDAWNVFEYWYIKNVEIEDIYSQDITFKMPANDVYVEAVFGPNRLNTNIYKNIFPEDVFDYGRIMTLQETAPTTLQDITQENHGFIVGNIVSCVNGKYQKAIADNTEQGIPLGIVAAVHNENVFTLLSTGIFNWKQYNYEDTSVLYLSDTIPGTLVHYSQIKTNIYVPVAVYINNNQILLNLQDKTVGAPMAPYEQYSQNFDTYDKSELDEIVQHAISGVI